MSASGVQVLECNPVNPLVARKDWEPNQRDHRKLLIVDGCTAFLGGINIRGVYSSGSMLRRRQGSGDAPTWRDTDLQIDGPVVAEFQKLFLQTWRALATPHDRPAPERSIRACLGVLVVTRCLSAVAIRLDRRKRT